MEADYSLRPAFEVFQTPTGRERCFVRTKEGPDDTPYPTEEESPTVYYAERLHDVSFPHEVGMRDLSYTQTGLASKDLYFFNLQDKYLPEGTVLMVFREYGQWFTMQPAVSSDLVKIARLPTGTSSIPAMANDVPGSAVCEIFVIEEGVIVPLLDDEEQPVTELVYNIFPFIWYPRLIAGNYFRIYPISASGEDASSSSLEEGNYVGEEPVSDVFVAKLYAAAYIPPMENGFPGSALCEFYKIQDIGFGAQLVPVINETTAEPHTSLVHNIYPRPFFPQYELDENDPSISSDDVLQGGYFKIHRLKHGFYVCDEPLEDVETSSSSCIIALGGVRLLDVPILGVDTGEIDDLGWLLGLTRAGCLVRVPVSECESPSTMLPE